MYRFALAILLLSLHASQTQADIVWQFESSNATNSLTGQLTTTGNAGDDTVVNTVLNLVTIDSISFNGSPITNFSGGSTLPFIPTISGGLPDQIRVVSAGLAELDAGSGNSLQGRSDDFNFNFIVLARPGTGVQSDILDSVPAIPGFVPTTLRFTTSAIPEPSSILLVGLAGLIVILSRGRTTMRRVAG